MMWGAVTGNGRLLLLVLLAAAAAVAVENAALPTHRQQLGVGEQPRAASWGGAGGNGSELVHSSRALRADRCTGCDPDQCFPASGCASCSVEAGYQPDGAGGCTKGEPATLAANPGGPNARTAAVTRLSFHPLCGDYAVLRAGGSGSVFGFGPAGATVAVRLMNSGGHFVAAKSAKINSSGEWRVKLGKLKAGSPFALSAQAAGSKVVARNIAIGHLLLASGQSNMYFSLADIRAKYPNSNWAALAKQAVSNAPKNKAVRLFKVPLATSSSARVTVNAKWSVPTSQYVSTYSAVAYLLGLQLQQAMRVPIGIVQSSYGGTSITQWISPAMLRSQKVPGTTRTVTRLNTYNAMIVPLRYADFDGIAWYQGESDGGLTLVTPMYAFYTRLLQALMREWRALFGNPKLHFEIVQIQLYRPRYAKNGEPARYGLNHWPFVREAQRRVARGDPYSGLVSVLDLGVDGQIHAPDKWDVAARLVRGVRRHIFGTKLVDTGPTFRSVAYATRQAIVVFDNVGSGFVVGIKANNVGGVTRQPGAAINCFQLRYRGRWYTAVGKVAGRKATLSVSTSDRSVGRPDGLRYGWADNPHCNLYSSGSLPVVPFTTDGTYDVGPRQIYG